MERRSFLRLCGLASGAALVGGMLPGCMGVAHVQAAPVNGVAAVPLHAFTMERKGEQVVRRSIVVDVQGLPAPIVVFRNGEHNHIALLMRCTHRGAELQLAGDRLDCPAHGSVFSDQGEVMEGPADAPLRRFPVTASGTDLLIRLA
ncbi:MAG: Rieske (2Fe-2S) protein [Flavobacteriales bacterium]|nr:Rieske (2Fe-2S) protein [Flavobacteriales bacterium]